MVETQHKVILITSFGSAMLYLFKNDIHDEASRYRDSSGKFVWWKFTADLFIHVGMALFGAIITYYIFETAFMVDYKEWQLVGSVLAGVVARDTLPIILNVLVEEVNYRAEQRKLDR